jgi:hypothetical protein
MHSISVPGMGTASFPATGYHPAFPPVSCCTGGSPIERVQRALGWAPPEGWDLHSLAYRAGLGMGEVRPPLRALRQQGAVRYRELPGHMRHGEWHAPVVLIRLEQSPA